MTLTLSRALNLGDREIISLVGGGGKTTLMFALGRELSADKKGVLLTTTTKIWDPGPSPEFALFLSTELQELKQRVKENLGRTRYLVAAREKLDNGKLAGIPPFWVEELLSVHGLSHIVVEADGAAGRPLKAPREGEPVLPSGTTLLIPVAGIDGMGRPLEERYVFRAQIATKVLEKPEGSIVTGEMIARLIAEMLKNKPEKARVISFINKVDLPGGMEKAEMLARNLLEPIFLKIERVVLGEAQGEPVVKGVVERSFPS